MIISIVGNGSNNEKTNANETANQLRNSFRAEVAGALLLGLAHGGT